MKLKPSALKVLDVLRLKKNQGVTFDNFPRGTCVTKRISELRQAGFNIISTPEILSNGGRRAIWTLIGEAE